MKSKFDIAVSSASKSELSNWKKKSEIKYDKDNRKIENKFIFLFSYGSYKVFYQGKPAVFGTAFEREPGFITENLIKYRIQCLHFDGTCVWVWGERLQQKLLQPILS